MEDTSLFDWLTRARSVRGSRVFVFLCLVGMSVWEYFAPGGSPRRGILGLDTTRGDRLFISLLGSAFIFLAWLGLMGTPLWGGLAIAILYALAVFRWV